MSSKLFKGSVITKEAGKSKPVKMLRTQTAKQAKAAIKRKYGSIVSSAEYYHRGSGVWIKYSKANDKKRTSKGAKKSIPKGYSSKKHQIDVRGVDTKVKRKAIATKTRKAARKVKKAAKTKPKAKPKIIRVIIPKPTAQKKYAGFLISGDTYTARRSIKAMGGKWKKDLVAWVVPSNKANATAIREMKKARKITVSAYKTDVNPFKRLNAAEKLAVRESKLLAKAERLEGKAGRQTAEATRRYASAEKTSERFYMGQPILVGHHSEGKARRDQAKMWRDTEKSIAASKEATEAARKAQSTKQFAKTYTGGNVTVLKGRIKKLEGELKKQENAIKKIDKTIPMMKAANKAGVMSYSKSTIARYEANKEAAKRRIPDIKEDIRSLKALLPKGAAVVSPGVNMKDITGAKLKKATGADRVNKSYHNKNLKGGNFGIIMRDGNRMYDLRGDHDPDGVIYSLRFDIGSFGRYGTFGSVITRDTYKKMTPAKLYSILADGIKKGKKVKQ